MTFSVIPLKPRGSRQLPKAPGQHSVVHFPSQSQSIDSGIQALKERLANQARLLEQEDTSRNSLYQPLTEQQRLEYTQQLYRVYTENGIKSSLANIIVPCNAIALKFVILYAVHQIKKQTLNFVTLDGIFQKVTNTPLILDHNVIRDYFQAKELVVQMRAEFPGFREKQAEAIYALLHQHYQQQLGTQAQLEPQMGPLPKTKAIVQELFAEQANTTPGTSA